MNIRQPGFKLGEEVMMMGSYADGAVFHPVIVTKLTGPAPDMAQLRVRPTDGREITVFTRDCHRRSPEFDIWWANLIEKEGLTAKLAELCKNDGLIFGGPACRRLPEWAAYAASMEHLRTTSAAAFAVHPYSYERVPR